mmetsp:Transcript_21671/g.84405  ORF Transcript_21671/g.84405 Transcript_21671/m.84405 type:complete len:428 (+) Transcript_21671:1981-3264(+)
MTATRLIASVCSSAMRLSLTRPASCSAASSARGSASSALKVCCQASTAPSSSSASQAKVRQKRFRASCGRGIRLTCGLGPSAGPPQAGPVEADCGWMPRAASSPRGTDRACPRSARQDWARGSRVLVGHEDVAHAPDGLDVARLGRVGLEHLAQPRDLHVQAAVEGLELAAAGELGQLVAAQGLARVAHQGLEHRELAGGQRQLLAVLGQPAQREVELEGAEGDGHRLLARRARGFGRRAAAQHRVDAGQQFARIEGLGEIVVRADLQADDAVHVLDLGGQHDDGRAVVGGAQPAADGQAVFAGQHQVQHDQVHRLAGELLVQGPAVLGQQHLEAFLGEVAPQQVADAGVVVDDEDAVGACARAAVHRGSRICNSRIVSRFVRRAAAEAAWRYSSLPSGRACRWAKLDASLLKDSPCVPWLLFPPSS